MNTCLHESSKTSPEDRIKLLALSLIDGFGSRTYKKLMRLIGNISELDTCTNRDLYQVMPRDIAIKISSKQYLHPIEEYIQRLQRLGVSYITMLDDEYPTLLKQIYDPPPILYVRGKYSLKSLVRCISVVGTRACSYYGEDVTRHLVSDLVQSGFTIVSGMAFGIDTIAHCSALDANGMTIAVLSGRVDKPSPQTNHIIYERIIKDCFIISECPIHREINSGMFPVRNRIIAGLSLGTLVIEAPVRSGALITARIALDENREVFAVPSNIFRKQGEGVNQLIKQGRAKLIENVKDIIEELGFFAYNTEKKQEIELDAEERSLLEIIQREPCSVDDISKKVKLDISSISTILGNLEIRGVVRREMNGEYTVVV